MKLPLRVSCMAAVLVGALPGQSFTLRQAVAEALERYPATKVSLEKMAAAAGAVNLARTAYLPRLDFSAQASRATRNNVFGLLFPQAGVPGISGPVLGTNSLESVWGSAVGLQFAWEPFDFGLRRTNVAQAEAGRRRAEASVDRTRFEVASAAADAFLTLVAAQQTAIAAEAGVRRSKVLQTTVDALVNSQLRPGADASRARAEAAAAEIQLIQAQQAIDAGKASLSQFVGTPPERISIQPDRLLNSLPDGAPLPGDVASHPILVEQHAAIQEAEAAQRVLDKSYYPRFNLLGAIYGRGTGAMTDGTTMGGLSGLGPNIHNWAVGFAVTFPLLDLPSLKVRKEIAAHQQLAETARYEKERQDLSSELARARAALEGARKVAQNTPVQVAAARDAERQATARYKAGLGTLIEVTDAQRLVTQSEIEDNVARVAVWRAELGIRMAEGDLEPLLRRTGP
ncbi:MAG: TolC family protein [Bryobacteraceae bacterium]